MEAGPGQTRPRVVQSVSWLLRESGLSSLWSTGRDAWLIIVCRTSRMFAFGGVSLIMALFFSALRFTDFQIGLFMTLTLAGDVVLSFVITMSADAIGRRRTVFAGGALMTVSGLVFLYFENFFVLLVAAVVGVISATGGDFGPFRAIEESVLSHLTDPKTRSDVLSWYVTASGLGSAAGIEVMGRLVGFWRERWRWSDIHIYHVCFGVYVVVGLANMLIAFCLTSKCEISPATTAEESADDPSEAAQGLLSSSEDEEDHQHQHHHVPQEPTKKKATAKKSYFAQISASTRSLMYRLWFLLTVDSLADGMVSYTLTTYYLDQKFHLSESKLGDIMSATHILGSVSTVFAGPLSRYLGLVPTMVFTHIPSSAAVLLFPAPTGVVMTVILLFVRGGLNNMDQAPRAALIAAIVRPEERTAVMGITSTLRTLASTVGPLFTGLFAETDMFWIAFVAAGVLRLAYDFGLWIMFVKVDLYQHEGRVEDNGGAVGTSAEDDGSHSESSIELEALRQA